jgi:hypothetical protein
MDQKLHVSIRTDGVCPAFARMDYCLMSNVEVDAAIVMPLLIGDFYFIDAPRSLEILHSSRPLHPYAGRKIGPQYS